MEIALPFRLGPSGQVATVDDPELLLRQHIQVLLSTRIGERVMLVDYGSNAEALVFDVDIDEVGQEIAALTRSAFQTYMPEANIISIGATESDGTVNLSVQYSFKQAMQSAVPQTVYTATFEIGGKVDMA